MRHFAEIGLRRAAIVFVFLVVPVLATPNFQTPGIKVATRLVEFGVIARDKGGLVENMTKDDFVVLDRGNPQTISVFTPESSISPTTATEPPKMLPQNTFSNLSPYGASRPRSVTIVLLDNLNTLYGSAPESQYESTPFWVEDLALERAKTHLIEFLKTLDPRDRVAIYGLRDSLHVLSDFTSDRSQLLAIVSKYDASSATNRATAEPAHRKAPVLNPETAAERAANPFENAAALRLAGMANERRAQITMAALASLANHVANIPGRKNLVWLTAELPFSGSAMAHILAPANIAAYPVDARGLLGLQTPTAANLTGTADADDVSGASGHWDNMPGQSSVPIGISTMQKLAEETGGQAVVNTNDITGAIRKAVEDSAVTYVLGFYIKESSLDGKFHEIKVQSKRKDVTLRYPKGYLAYRDMPVTRDQNHKALETAVHSPVESSLIPLQARLEKVNQPEVNSFSIACSIDVHNLRWTQTTNVRKGSFTVYVIGQDPAGKVLQEWDKTFDFQFTDDQYAALLKTGMLFHQIVHAGTGVTNLRLIVEDPSTTQTGSLIIALTQVN